ncbi:MAG: putative porin [Alloprevotella sp.]|nr:putative porin [Alloprevotella sp.]
MYLLYIIPLCALQMVAQRIQPPRDMESEGGHFLTDSVKKVGVPEGISAWTVDRRFGSVRPAAYDTVPHLFQNEAFTDGPTGRYNFLGNLGSPRQSRVFSDRKESTFDGNAQFVFAQPYDFFLYQPDELLYTNTKSPFTNLTYHECGNKQNGEDRFRALFSTNINKRVGLGFKIDYLYGRGYYDSQATSQFDGTLFGSYISTRYSLHAFYAANHMKTSENGGLENDYYVNSPEAFPTKYSTADMPMSLSKSYNKLNVNTLYLTHRYNLGFTRFRDPDGNIVRISRDKGAERFSSETSGQEAVETTATGETDEDEVEEGVRYEAEFIPVTSFFHTLRIDHNNRRFLSNAPAAVRNAYFTDFYLPGDSANDFTRYAHIDNTIGIELHEGLNKWMRTGFRLFARHELHKFSIPGEATSTGLLTRQSFTENHFSVGGQLLKEKGERLHYHALGELRTSGKTWGEFNVEADASLKLPLRRDTLSINLDGHIRRERPSFYLRHYHGRNAWWDADLEQQFRFRVGGELRYKQTRLSFHMENIQKYAYLQETQVPYSSADGIARSTYGVGIAQTGGGVQLLEATLRQDIRLGILHWDNELTVQATTNKDVLPLPAFTAWSNLYLQFYIARVLRTEIGADVRYFTSYYAPAYSPIIGQYAVQDPDARIKIGNYPVINAYANFHLKRTRFYVMASHVNYSSGTGCPFLVPHYPLNRLVLRLGVSWNFIN